MNEILSGQYGEFAARPIEGEVLCSDETFGNPVADHLKWCWCIPDENIRESEEKIDINEIDLNCSSELM